MKNSTLILKDEIGSRRPVRVYNIKDKSYQDFESRTLAAKFHSVFTPIIFISIKNYGRFKSKRIGTVGMWFTARNINNK